MRFTIVSLFMFTFVASNLNGQTLVPAASNSTSQATAHIVAEPVNPDPMDPPWPGNGSSQSSSNNTGSAAGAGASDGNEASTGTVSLSTEGFALPNQVTAGAGFIGGLWSHNGRVTLTDNLPPVVNPAIGVSGIDADGDGIDDAIDASVIVGPNVLIDLPDVNGNGIDDAVDAIPGAIQAPALAGGNDAFVDTVTRGVYVFNRPPAPAGFVWVASGSYSIAIGGNTVAVATANNPAVAANVENVIGTATASVVDVLAGSTTNTFVLGAEGIAGPWSVVVGVGAANPFPQTVSVHCSTPVVTASGGQSINFAGSSTANIEIQNVTLVAVGSIPQMVVVNVGLDGDGGDDGGMGDDDMGDDDMGDGGMGDGGMGDGGMGDGGMGDDDWE